MSEHSELVDAVEEPLERQFVAGSRVTNCVMHMSLDLLERPKDCSRCRTDLENQLSFAIRVNEFLNKQLDDTKAAWLTLKLALSAAPQGKDEE